MKHSLKLLALLVAVMTTGACSVEPENDNLVVRNIVYFIDEEEHQVTLRDEGEWDRLLDELLDHSAEGSTVMFYNADLQQGKTAAPKKDVTFSTRDRKQMKDWCKKMEREGMTVTITYDRENDRWNGVASKNRKPSKNIEI